MLSLIYHCLTKYFTYTLTLQCNKLNMQWNQPSVHVVEPYPPYINILYRIFSYTVWKLNYTCPGCFIVQNNKDSIVQHCRCYKQKRMRTQYKLKEKRRFHTKITLVYRISLSYNSCHVGSMLFSQPPLYTTHIPCINSELKMLCIHSQSELYEKENKYYSENWAELKSMYRRNNKLD